MERMSSANFLTVKEALRQIRQGALDPAELQRTCMRQIERLILVFQRVHHGGASGWQWR